MQDHRKSTSSDRSLTSSATQHQSRRSSTDAESRLNHAVQRRLSMDSDAALRSNDSELKQPGSQSRHAASTILPPAAFFAPKRASERPGAVSPIGRRSPFSQLNEETLQEPTSWGEGSVRSNNSMPMVAISNKASTDPLLPAKALRPPPSPPKAASLPATQPRKRRHAHHLGANRFLLGGWIMTSDDNPLAFLGSLALLLVLGGLFFGFEASWAASHISPGVVAVFAYLFALAVVNMLVTAWKDPGVVPRELDADPPCELGEARPADPEDPLAQPVTRLLRVRGQQVSLKWCDTCHTYRPPRASHCRVCDNCVENIDHHCTFLNTCIGRRNYVPFMVFLTASILSACIVIALAAAHLALLTKPRTYTYPRGQPGEAKDFRQALAASPVSAVLFLLTIATLGPILVLFSYHIRLIALNRSTVEQIRISTAREYGEKHWQDHEDASTGVLRLLGWKREKDPNPFATGRISRNVRNGLGWRSVALESWLDRRQWYMQDDRRPNPATTAAR